jgi:hypothetical protein
MCASSTAALLVGRSIGRALRSAPLALSLASASALLALPTVRLRTRPLPARASLVSFAIMLMFFRLPSWILLLLGRRDGRKSVGVPRVHSAAHLQLAHAG